MISSSQQALLASIQALAAAGRGQTGWSIDHRVEFSASGHTYSTVTCRPPGRITTPDGDPSHMSWATVSPDGVDVAEDMEPEFLATHECTLAQQLDRLAHWIAANRIRKEGAA